MFKLSPEPFDLDALRRRLAFPHAGALATFEGRVRDHNDGRPVVTLEYEAFAALAEKEGARILAEVREKFPVLDAICVHRTGSLRPGDLAVWIGVASAHRAAAFDACRYVLDEAKARVPIWKKEHYADGASVWINSATRGEFSRSGPPNFIEP